MKSKNPRKQRKWLYNAPLHRRGKIMCVPLSKDLAEEIGVKSLPVRKGDTVLVTSGEFKGTEGKIVSIDRKNYRLVIKEIVVEKADGTEYNMPISYSNVVITKLEKDKWRDKIIERKSVARIKEA
ncbi:MAG: 50S ribosomal protein L24 [Candidatus Odinarchaeia archaeon]